jgi:hypothetical protein
MVCTVCTVGHNSRPKGCLRSHPAWPDRQSPPGVGFFYSASEGPLDRPSPGPIQNPSNEGVQTFGFRQNMTFINAKPVFMDLLHPFRIVIRRIR